MLDDGEVLTIGKGYQGDDHYGKKNFDMGKADFLYYYAKPLSEEDFENGKTRWHWWHLDGTFYQYEPPTFTSFRSLKLPNEEREQEVEWADGSGLSMKVKPGRTAFLDTAQLYNMLSDDEKKMADHSWVEYMWYPYEYVKACRGNPNGIGVASEGKETPMEEMEKIANVKPEWQKTVRTGNALVPKSAHNPTAPHGMGQPCDGRKVVPSPAQLRAPPLPALQPVRGAQSHRRRRRGPPLPVRHPRAHTQARVHLGRPARGGRHHALPELGLEPLQDRLPAVVGQQDGAPGLAAGRGEAGGAGAYSGGLIRLVRDVGASS